MNTRKRFAYAILAVIALVLTALGVLYGLPVSAGCGGDPPQTYTLSVNKEGTGEVWVSEWKFDPDLLIMAWVKIGEEGSYTRTAGTVLLVSVASDDPWRIHHWIDNGTQLGAGCSYSVTFNTNHNVTAVFQETCVLTLETDPPSVLCVWGPGTVLATDPDSLDIVPRCVDSEPLEWRQYRFWKDTRVTIRAIDGPWFFQHWDGPGLTQMQKALPIVQFTLGQTETVTGVFQPALFTVYVDEITPGSCLCWGGINWDNPLSVGGHAWWGIAVAPDQLSSIPADLREYIEPNRWGFYAVGTPYPCTNPDLPGRIQWDAQRAYNRAFSFPIPLGNAIPGLQRTEELDDSPPNYNLRFYNCVDATIDVGGAAGRSLPASRCTIEVPGECVVDVSGPGLFACNVAILPRWP